MKNMRNIVAAIVMVTVLSVSTFAEGIVVAGKDGIVVAGRAEQRQKTSSCSGTTRESGIVVAGGILVAGLTGIVVAGFTGIVVAGSADTGNTNCGIVVAG